MTSDQANLPHHVVIAPDGNNRWAAARNLPRIQGHLAGVTAFMETVENCVKAEIPYLTLHAFTVDNWRRDPQEVAYLMTIVGQAIDDHLDQLHAMNVRVQWAGRRDRIPPPVRTQLEAAEQRTAANSGMQFTYCVDYGGREDIASAATRAAQDLASGNRTPEQVATNFRDYLDPPGLPDIDLYIRTSGEQRISNTLLWHLSHAELVFLDVLWPDFTQAHLEQAFKIYASRERRLGGR